MTTNEQHAVRDLQAAIIATRCARDHIGDPVNNRIANTLLMQLQDLRRRIWATAYYKRPYESA